MKVIVKMISELTSEETMAMLRLMQKYYSNVNEEQFIKDLAEKDKVILLYGDETICGFSTWMLFTHNNDGFNVNVIFSGDTIVDEKNRNSLALPVAWGKLMLLSLEKFPERPLYWLLTSKGYKTYRFLPIFFNEFYPSYLHKTPEFEKSLLISLIHRKFRGGYNPVSCVLEAGEGAQCLRPGMADVSPPRLRDKHINFFYHSNPDYTKGDELVCIARCQPENLTPFIMRQLLK